VFPPLAPPQALFTPLSIERERGALGDRLTLPPPFFAGDKPGGGGGAGGVGSKLSDETKQKISEVRKGILLGRRKQDQ
jgi:hypothetical protein